MSSLEPDSRNPELSRLLRLTHHRWVIPLVVAVGPGERFAVLQRKLGVARQTLTRAVDAARDLGLVRRNPGHGHPLRPEYLLTPAGERIRESCARILRAARAADAGELVARKWVLPVLASLSRPVGPGGSGAMSFAELQRAAAPITPAALTTTLDELLEAGWIQRDERAASRPGRAPYRIARGTEAARRARMAARGARELAGS